MRYRVEVGNCAVSEYVFCDTESEARDAREELILKWEESGNPECQGDSIETDEIFKMSGDEDGEYDRDLDEII